MDVWADEVGGTFCSGGMTEEGILTLVLSVIDDEVTNIGRNECC